MADYVENILLIKGKEKDVNCFLEMNWSKSIPFFFDSSYSHPESLCFESMYPVSCNSQEYEWKMQHWGTEYADTIRIDWINSEKLLYYFQTPWNPPKGWFQHIVPKFKQLNIGLYYDSFMRFSGYMIAKHEIILKSKKRVVGDDIYILDESVHWLYDY
jgi:hypothetical protein